MACVFVRVLEEWIYRLCAQVLYLYFCTAGDNGNAMYKYIVCECVCLCVCIEHSNKNMLHTLLYCILCALCCAMLCWAAKNCRHMHLLHVLFTYSHHVANLNIFCFTNFLHLSFSVDAIVAATAATVAAAVVVFVVSIRIRHVMFYIYFYRMYVAHCSAADTFSHCLSIHLVECTRFFPIFLSLSTLYWSYFTDNKRDHMPGVYACFCSRETDSLQMVTR